MRHELVAWLDRHAAADWRTLHKLWHIRLAIFWTLVSGAGAALPQFGDLIGPWWLLALTCVSSLLMLFASYTHQPGVIDD